MPLRKRSPNPWMLALLLSMGVGCTAPPLRLSPRQSSTSGAMADSDNLPTELSVKETEASRPSDSEDSESENYGYERHPVGKAIAHVVTQPPGTKLSIAVADDLATVEAFAEQTDAQYIINGGFFDPNNGKTTSHLIAGGQVIGDPTNNERLTGNLELSQYMPQILNRSEFRVYRCQEINTPVYDITFHDALPPDGCELDTAIGAGPQLLPVNTSQTEAFVDYEDDVVIRDAIGGFGPNARSAIGLNAEGVIALIMVEKGTNSSGLTLAELADFAASIGITKLLNLDGGSSSALFVTESATAGNQAEQAYFGLSDAEGNPIKRAVKSVILLER